MNKLFIFLFVLCVKLPDFVQAQPILVFIVISNPISDDRKEEVLAIKWTDILAKYPKIDTANFKIINLKTKEELPWQLETKGGKDVQNLLVQLDVAAKSTVKLGIQEGKSAVVKTKTFGRYVPERKDDFAWENDKIAFRMYGKALEQSPSEMAYGLDVWVKRTDKMVLNDRYKRGNYHIDIGDGMDYYHVGFTLGAGNIAPVVNDSIYYSQNYVRWKVLDNGPLRTSFQLEYNEWAVNGTKISVVKTISLDAGSQLSRIEAQFSQEQKLDLPVVVGIVKRKEPGAMLLDEQQSLMAYWEPQFGEDGITGVGSILLNPVTKIKVTNEQILSYTISKNGEPVVYYTGAAWNKANEIISSKAWFDYIQLYKNRLSNPLKIVLE
ncbi:MAG: DUF4861 family protein [Bacteroidia bacterium]